MICKSSTRRLPHTSVLLALVLLAVGVFSAQVFNNQFTKGTKEHLTLQTEEEEISLETARERFQQSLAETYKYAKIIAALEAEAENAALEAELVRSMSIPVELMEEVVDMMLSEKKIASLAEDTRVREVGQATYRTIKEALKEQPEMIKQQHEQALENQKARRAQLKDLSTQLLKLLNVEPSFEDELKSYTCKEISFNPERYSNNFNSMPCEDFLAEF